MEKRLIDANALKNDINAQVAILNAMSISTGIDELRQIGEKLQQGMIAEIDKQPTVDAVQVVRCGKCLWFAEFCTDFKAKTHCDGMCENPRLDRCVHGDYVLKNWFCADGERRTE